MAIFNITVKARHIRLLVISIAISLLSLLALQFYWLQNAVQLQRENFTILANNAVQDIVKRLESQEAIGAFMRASMRVGPRESAPKSAVPKGYDQFMAWNDQRLSDENLPMHVPGAAFRTVDTDSLTEALERILGENELAGNREFMLEFMQEVQQLRTKDIFERVQAEQLDSIILFVFNKYDLSRDFVYEIVRADNEFFKRVANENKTAGTQNVFLAKLFPRDHLSSNHYLVFRFHNQKAYFFSNISSQMIFSLLAIVLLGLSFYLLVDLLMRQKRLSEMKTDFINNMTHELKTPIATINLASEALIEMQGADASAARYNRIIFDENQRLKRHVERILNIALLERSGFSLRLKEHNIHELLSRIAEQSDLMVQKQNGKLVLRLLASKTQLQVDEMHFINVITNLIDNALKYCKQEPEVFIETSSTETHLIVAVRDNGIGMTQAQTKKIFDKFYRVPTGDVHDVKGFGLGLSYVLSITELHGGKVEVHSEPGKGSTFTLSIPYEKT